jgi:hypothetical protein
MTPFKKRGRPTPYKRPASLVDPLSFVLVSLLHLIRSAKSGQARSATRTPKTRSRSHWWKPAAPVLRSRASILDCPTLDKALSLWPRFVHSSRSNGERNEQRGNCNGDIRGIGRVGRVDAWVLWTAPTSRKRQECEEEYRQAWSGASAHP